MVTTADPGAIDLQYWHDAAMEADTIEQHDLWLGAIAAVRSTSFWEQVWAWVVSNDLYFWVPVGLLAIGFLIIDLGPYLSKRFASLWHNKDLYSKLMQEHDDMASIEALRERVAELEGACRIVLAELPQDDEGTEIGDLDRLLCACRAALAATPAEAIERAKAKDAVVDQADEIYTRLLVLKLVGKFVPPDDAVALELHELGNRLAKFDALKA